MPVKRVVALLLGFVGAGCSFKGTNTDTSEQQVAVGSDAWGSGSGYGSGSGSGSDGGVGMPDGGGIPNTPDPNCTASEDVSKQFVNQAAPLIGKMAAGDLDL